MTKPAAENRGIGQTYLTEPRKSPETNPTIETSPCGKNTTEEGAEEKGAAGK